jgi:transposase
MSKKSKYSQEFRETAIQLVAASGDKPVAQTAKELGVDKHLLYGWVKAAQGKQTPSTQHKKETSAEQQLKQLQRRNKELEMENEILKKAAAYFAKSLL